MCKNFHNQLFCLLSVNYSSSIAWGKIQSINSPIAAALHYFGTVNSKGQIYFWNYIKVKNKVIPEGTAFTKYIINKLQAAEMVWGHVESRRTSYNSCQPTLKLMKWHPEAYRSYKWVWHDCSCIVNDNKCGIKENHTTLPSTSCQLCVNSPLTQ